uniref:Uncharacterized protein n=1 Tax=Pipistrellus kuhlii TaxID=59472 RepID=A0A7J7YWN7_PIPKU|nr:hypothetical protein mPipKuh1_009840 [Pipistrellus kuhlii]
MFSLTKTLYKEKGYLSKLNCSGILTIAENFGKKILPEDREKKRRKRFSASWSLRKPLSCPHVWLAPESCEGRKRLLLTSCRWRNKKGKKYVVQKGRGHPGAAVRELLCLLNHMSMLASLSQIHTAHTGEL